MSNTPKNTDCVQELWASFCSRVESSGMKIQEIEFRACGIVKVESGMVERLEVKNLFNSGAKNKD